MTALDEWAQTVATALGIPGDIAGAENGRDIVLDLARDVAHGVMRPAAPLTSYLLGIAVGRGADPATAAAIVAETVRTWPQSSAED